MQSTRSRDRMSSRPQTQRCVHPFKEDKLIMIHELGRNKC